jgi:uncharacterized protein (TIGR00369 family)
MNDISGLPSEPQSAPPQGFNALALGRGNDFIGIVGPLYSKGSGADVVFGFRVQQRHCNPMNVCHGGMLSTFADMTLAIGANHAEGLGRFLPTVSLSCDFLAPAPLGSWVEGRTQVLRLTRNLVFVRCLISADGALAVRSNAVLKLGPPLPFKFGEQA